VRRSDADIAEMFFAEPDKAKKDLHAFADANEQRLYKLFKTCVDVQSDLRTIVKARVSTSPISADQLHSICRGERSEPTLTSQNELSRRIEQSHSEILDTFSNLVESGSWNIVNHSSIPALITALQRPATNDTPRTQAVADAARRLMVLIAKEGAPMFKPHMAELALVMADRRNVTLSTTALQALSAVCKADPSSAPSDK
jgi:sister-chromatid-cohesion protein PDS5